MQVRSPVVNIRTPHGRPLSSFHITLIFLCLSTLKGVSLSSNQCRDESPCTPGLYSRAQPCQHKPPALKGDVNAGERPFGGVPVALSFWGELVASIKQQGGSYPNWSLDVTLLEGLYRESEKYKNPDCFPGLTSTTKNQHSCVISALDGPLCRRHRVMQSPLHRKHSSAYPGRKYHTVSIQAPCTDSCSITKPCMLSPGNPSSTQTVLLLTFSICPNNCLNLGLT